jgi:hypothetical protein
MSGGTETTTTTQNNDPWSGAQPALKTALGNAENLYKSGVGFQPYTGSTVVPYADQTMAGMQGIQDASTGAMGSFDTTGFLRNLLSGSSGLTGMQQGVADQWGGVAAGNELFGQNPAFQRVLKQAQDDTALYSDLGASGAGRYGSAAHTNVMARNIGNLTDRMLTNEYGRQLGRQDAARTNLANMGQQGLQNRFGAAGALPAAWQAQFAPEQSLMGVGSMYEDLYGRTLGDNLRIFQETQQAPLNAVEWLNAIGSGAGSIGGSGTTTAQTPGTNPLIQALGIGLSIPSLLP